ncbi:DUF493 domain-containing protein [Endozoicomonas sp. Mp262]|uniref:HP0495 family protein n=1 Tax=Endozoicomonas sp. Mp262 TaxID=2919499 RepID=UPI0021DB1F47
MADSSNNQDAPKIVFPCDYPIRIMGAAAPDFKDFVVRVVKKHARDFDGKADVKASRTGKYFSVHVVIRATGEQQLKALHEELKASGRVQMVL